MIENSFRLQIMNVSETPRRYTISVSGLAGIEIESDRVVDIPAATTRSVVVEVHAPAGSGKQEFNRIYFDVKAVDDEKIAVREPASFIMP